MRSLLVIAYIITCLNSSHAQEKFYPGVLISQGDSIPGFLSLKKSINEGFKLSFRESSEKPAREIKPITGTQALIEGRGLFTAAKWKGSDFFFENLIAGEYASLLRQNGMFFIHVRDSVMVLENSVTFVEGRQVVKKKFVGTLGAAMADCPSILSETSQAELTEPSLARLVRSYNSCKGAGSFELRKTVPKTKPVIGISVGGMQTSFKGAVGDGSLFLYGYFDDRVVSNVNPSIGITIDLQMTRLNRNFFFSPEIRFSLGRYQETFINNLSTYNVNLVTIENSFIAVPILFTYFFSEPEKNGFLVKGGALTSYNVSRSFENRATQSGSPQVPALVDKSLRLRTMQHGFAGGFGYRSWIGKSTLKVEIRYENYGPFNDDSAIGLNKRSVGLIVSYSF